MPEIDIGPTPVIAEPKAPEAPKAPDTLLTPAAPVKLEPKAIVNPDGTFVENWREVLPEEIRNEECLKLVKDFPDAMKQFVHQRKAIGGNKVAVPKEGAKPEVWDAFFEAIGRPKTSDDYQFELPEDMKQMFPDDRLAAVRKFAHEIGATQKQFAAYMQYEIESANQLLADQEDWETKEKLRVRREADEALHQEFGAAYDERIHVSNRLIAEALPNEEEQMKFLEEFGDNPRFIRFASMVGARMTEHKALIAELKMSTPTEALSKIKELDATPGYLDLGTKMTPEEREAITERKRELYKQAYPEPAKQGGR